MKMDDKDNGVMDMQRRNLLKSAALGLAGAGLFAAGATIDPQKAAAQSSRNSLLRKVLDRGKLKVGTGSTNAPWHFENEQGKLEGMDVTMGRILALGLFQDENAIEFVKQAPDARIPNITTGKVDVVAQFMTVSPERSQVVAFSRPYYVEGVALLLSAKGKYKSYKALLKAGSKVRTSVLQNVYAEELVHAALPKSKAMLIDNQANVIQAVDAGRADAAAIDLSTAGWMIAQNKGKYINAGHTWSPQLYSAAVKQGDYDWLHFIDTVFNIAMFGHQHDLYAKPYEKYFGSKPPAPTAGFPSF